jgi:hypothetical protein
MSTAHLEDKRAMTAASAIRAEGTTDLFRSAIETVRRLAPETQDDIARAMLELAQLARDPGDSTSELELDEDLREALAEAERGDFASDEEVRAVWAKFGL